MERIIEDNRLITKEDEVKENLSKSERDLLK